MKRQKLTLGFYTIFYITFHLIHEKLSDNRYADYCTSWFLHVGLRQRMDLSAWRIAMLHDSSSENTDTSKLMQGIGSMFSYTLKNYILLYELYMLKN